MRKRSWGNNYDLSATRILFFTRTFIWVFIKDSVLQMEKWLKKSSLKAVNVGKVELKKCKGLTQVLAMPENENKFQTTSSFPIYFK